MAATGGANICRHKSLSTGIRTDDPNRARARVHGTAATLPTLPAMPPARLPCENLLMADGERPNVILICADQWRGDCLGLDGHPVIQTPHLDDIAHDGMHFRRAYSATPSCVPARVALMTGLSQSTHRRVGYQDGINFDFTTTLPGEFGHAGYQTQAIGKMHVHPPRNRIGFDHVILHDGYHYFARKGNVRDEELDDYLTWLRAQPGQPVEADYNDTGLNPNSAVARPWDKEERLHPSNWVATEAIKWLSRRDPTAPFFLYLSFYGPHPPYDPPAWAFDTYLHDDLPEPPVGDWWTDYADYRDDHDIVANIAKLPRRLQRRAIAGYYGNITHIDNQINRFMDALMRHGLDRNTIIAFTADHGEMMGDHHQYRKTMPYEGSARVPLIFRNLADRAIPAGTASDAVVELRDVMPTLLDLADIPIPDEVEGRSLAPVIHGKSESVRGYLHGEHATLGQSLHYLTDDTYKYVWMSKSGTEHLFNLSADPGETHNLVADSDHADIRARLRSHLITELAGREEGYVRDGELVPARPARTLLTAPLRRNTPDPGDNGGHRG